MARGTQLLKLVEMLRRRLEGDFVFTVDDATTLSVLRARLASDDPAEVCVALDLLEKAAPADLADLLLAETSNASAAVRRYAIERLLALRPETLHGIRQRISIDPEPSVRNVAMAAVGASGTADAARELVACLDDPDASVRRAALTVLFRLPIEETRALAVEAVTSLAQSARAADRALAAAVAGTNGLRELVVQLLSDANFSVRRAAIQAAGTLRDPTLRPALLENLLTPRFAQAAGLALAAEGDVALPSLEALLDPASETLVARRVVYVLRTIGSPAAMRALAARLDFPEVTVRGGILFALDRLGYVARSEAEREHVSLLMREEITDATWALAARRDLGKEKRLEPVRAALQSEVADARLRVLHLLAFVHDPVAIHRAALHLADRSKNKRAFAHEVLDLTLDGDERALVLPLVDEAPLTERLRRLEAADLDTAPQTAAQRMAEIARRAPRRLRRFTADVALWAAGHATRTARGDGAASEEKEMLLIEKVIVLKTVAMFERTADELVAEIASIVEVIEHRTGDVIFEKGDAGESMYIVVSGSVRVYDGEKTLRVLGEREIFGELALLDPEPRSASVAAAEDTRLFRLDGDLFSQLMAANVDIVRGVLHILCERLRATSATTGRP